MHLPDGFLDVKTTLLAGGAAVSGIAVAVRQTRASINPRQMPLLGLAGAFVFAAQMLNFPIPGGTSGHLLGGPLAAILLGPAAAVIVMTCVILIQALVFSDGGITALGANVLNMGILSVYAAYLAFRLLQAWGPLRDRRGIVFAAAFAGWVGTVVSSIACAGELALAGTAPWRTVFPAMASVHMLIGLGEGLATGLIIAALLRSRPELVAGAESRNAQGVLGLGLVFSAGLALFVAPFACPWPDGLEAVASKLGLSHSSHMPGIPGLLPGYQAPFVGSPVLATALAALLGTIVAFASAYLLAKVVVPRPGAHPGEVTQKHI